MMRTEDMSEEAYKRKRSAEYQNSILKRGRLGKSPTRLINGREAYAELRYEVLKNGTFTIIWDLYTCNERTGRRELLFDERRIKLPPEQRSKLLAILQKLEDKFE